MPNCNEWRIIFDMRMLQGIVTMNCPDFVIFRSEHLYFRVDSCFLRGRFGVMFEVDVEGSYGFLFGTKDRAY